MANLPVPTIASEVPGNFNTAALWNASVFSSQTFLLNPPQFYGYQLTSQSLLSATWTPIGIDTEAFDTYGGHSTTTNTSRYVAQVAGVYYIAGSVGFVANSTDMRAAYIAKNGTEIGQTRAQMPPVSGHNSTAITIPALVQLNTGDYVEVWGYQGSAGSLGTVSDPGTTFTVWFVHA